MRAFLYAGQGSQFAGMGLDLYEKFPGFREVLDSIQLDFDFKKLMFEGPEEVLSETRYTQPCMAAFAAGVTEVLAEKGIKPEAACGLSLGEYGALYAAGAFDTQTYLDVVNFRGKAMQKAAEGIDVSMHALLGITAEEAEEACRAGSGKDFVTVVNYNCPGQYVICGRTKGAEAALAYADSHFKVRHVRLKTSGPFHTRYLKAAGDEMREFLKEIPFGDLSIPVAMNTTGRLYEKSADLKELLELQLQSPVRFEEDLRTLIEGGADEFIEIGPGKVLSGLLQKTARAIGVKVSVTAVSTAEDLEKL